MLHADPFHVPLQFVYRVLMKHCLNWASHELHVELASAHQNSDGDQSNRNNLRSSLIGPIPMLVGTDAHKSDDQFTIEKISQLKMNLFEVLSFPGYRRGHSSVQAGEYMYILGGKDVARHALNKVIIISIFLLPFKIACIHCFVVRLWCHCV